MSDKKAVTVTIYGNEYTLKGEADPNYIAELAKYVDGKMTEIGKKSSAPAAKVAILASMNIADEYHRLEKAKNENLKLIETLEKNILEMKKSSDGSLKHSLEQKEQLDKAKTETAEIKKKLEETAKSLEHQKTEVEQAKKEWENSQKVSSGRKAELEKLNEELEKLKSELTAEKAKAKEMLIEEEDVQSKSSQLNADLSMAKEEITKLKQDLEKAQHVKPTTSPVSVPTASFLPSDDKLSSLFKKIDAILE